MLIIYGNISHTKQTEETKLKQITDKQEFIQLMNDNLNEPISVLFDGAVDLVLYNELLNKEAWCENFKNSGDCYDNRLFYQPNFGFADESFFANADIYQIVVEVYKGAKDECFNPYDDYFYIDDNGGYNSFCEEDLPDIYDYVFSEAYSSGLELDDYNTRDYLDYEAIQMIDYIENNDDIISEHYDELVELVNDLPIEGGDN